MTINDIKQGDKFIYNNNVYMKLPAFVECYGNKTNAVDIITGTMMFIDITANIISLSEKLDDIDMTEYIKNIDKDDNTAEWLIFDDCEQFIAYCSKCNAYCDTRNLTNKCPKCHRIMIGEKDFN